ncbi:MAG: M24 family metallopeptidase [Clostridiaceae bacterium]|jgi:Xaa-Pro aminopeptidase|nr:M24 family metallopeptidase [Clostridiaceae bacterium]
MKEFVDKIREFLKIQGLNYLLVNSTNDFLVEYNDLKENSRFYLTDFTGSTGDALVTKDKIYLFVDGRYHIQADLEVNKDIVTVVKLQTGQNFIDEFCEYIKPNSKLGIFSYKTSEMRFEKLTSKLKDKNVFIKLLDKDPITKLNREPDLGIKKIPKSLTGITIEEKLKKILAGINQDDALLITNLENVSYIFNSRDFAKQYSAKIKAKALISHKKTLLFTPDKMESFENYIKNFKGNIYVDKSTINAHDYSLIKDRAKIFETNPVMHMKSIKTDEELEHYKHCFEMTDRTMYAIRAYINEHENLSEHDIDNKLEEYFYQFGAKSLSFKSIVAIDKNAALAHYSKTDKNVILKDGGLVLIDCGAYYDGGLATDITRVFVKGNPTELQKHVYTTVLKMFLNCFNYSLKTDTTGYEIDNNARILEEQNKIEGFEFNHGLGHGIGISVHEYPPNLSKNELAKVPIEENMCFTIEPGLYNEKFFGVRLENSCYKKYGIINSFTDMCYEKKLINFSMLNDTEKKQLKLFKVL